MITIEKRVKPNKSATKSQVFRFCCNCVQVTLIENRKCTLCDGRFLVEGTKPLSFFE
jgi:hypothetical protein|tara:strand:- start:165 stop:335 length:171 start_codon:yes stop_codon:yes gene_type:complete